MTVADPARTPPTPTSEATGFTVGEARYAVDNVDVDWSAQPARFAQDWVDDHEASRQDLRSTMINAFSFSEEETDAALDALNIDWNAEAAQSAARIGAEGKTCDRMISVLTENKGFTPDEARFGATSVGAC